MTARQRLTHFATCLAISVVGGFVGALAFLGYDAGSWIMHNTRRHT